MSCHVQIDIFEQLILGREAMPHSVHANQKTKSIYHDI